MIAKLAIAFILISLTVAVPWEGTWYLNRHINALCRSPGSCPTYQTLQITKVEGNNIYLSDNTVFTTSGPARDANEALSNNMRLELKASGVELRSNTMKQPYTRDQRSSESVRGLWAGTYKILGSFGDFERTRYCLPKGKIFVTEIGNNQLEVRAEGTEGNVAKCPSSTRSFHYTITLSDSLDNSNQGGTMTGIFGSISVQLTYSALNFNVPFGGFYYFVLA
jgi:hypothetical protein